MPITKETYLAITGTKLAMVCVTGSAHGIVIGLAVVVYRDASCCYAQSVSGREYSITMETNGVLFLLLLIDKFLSSKY